MPPAPVDQHGAPDGARPLALVTGASSGIGLELARVFARRGYDLVVAAEDDELAAAAEQLRAEGAEVRPVQVDLATRDGVEELARAVVDGGRPVDALAVNAGIVVGGPFFETSIEDHVRLVELNVTGAVRLTGLVGGAMVERGAGRILFTSSIAATAPGPWQASYNASKAFLASFGLALREELSGTGVTVTVLMPGPTDTEIFERGGLEDTRLGQAEKDDPADVAIDAFDALMAGDARVISGSWKDTAQVAAAKVLPEAVAAKASGHMTEPGSGS